MDRFEWIFLPAVIILISLGNVHGSCDPMNPCPPPFPDFMAIFSETLKKIPELRVDNWTSLSTECPASVNWTEFNSRLAAGDPVPLDPVCNRPTTSIPTEAVQSRSSDASSPFDIFTPPTEPSGSSAFVFASMRDPTSTEKGPAVGDLKQSDDSQKIGLPVGIAVGAAVLILIFVIVAVVRCRRKAKSKRVNEYLRNQSTTSQSVLVPQLDIPDSPEVQQKNVVIIPGFTCQESSTDATIRRPAGGVAVVVFENKISDEKDRRSNQGFNNKAFEAAEEDLEDPGYSGSEAWENEWNNKFEEAMIESNEDLAQDAITEGKEETESDSPEQKPSSRISILSNTSKDLPLATKSTSTPLNSPSAKKPPGLQFNLPSSTKPIAFPDDSSSPTNPSSSPLSFPSPKKHPALKFKLPSPTKTTTFLPNDSSPTKPLTSPFNQRSLTKSSASGVDQTASPSKPSLEQRPPSLTLTPDAPPAYSSPIVKPNETRPYFQTKPRESSVPATPPTASGLPTYTEVMAVRGTQSSSPPIPNSSQQKPRPTPPKRLDLAGAAVAGATVSIPLKSSQQPESSAPRNSNPWKMQTQQSRKATSEPEKPSNTAVVRPWTGSLGVQTLPGNSVLRSTPAEVTANPASATQEAPGGSVGEYSFRPVRSLLNQFETVDKHNK